MPKEQKKMPGKPRRRRERRPWKDADAPLAPLSRRDWERVAWRETHWPSSGRFREECMTEWNATKNALRDWAASHPLANAKKGEEYRCAITLPAGLENYAFLEKRYEGLPWDADIRSLEDLGLSWKTSGREAVISGTPKETGDFFLPLKYVIAGKPSWIGVPLTINPDPRDLWQEKDAVDEEYGLTQCRAGELAKTPEGEALLAASVRGRSHAHVGSPRDDSFFLSAGDAGEWHILAVADGAGSAPFSRKGSEIACRTAVAVCRERLAASPEFEALLATLDPATPWQGDARRLAYGILPKAAHEAFKAIRDEAQTKGRQPKEYASTLLLALVRRFPAGWLVASFQVGDGAMAVLYPEGENLGATLLAEPDEGEYGGQTRFITMRDIFSDSEGLLRRVRVDCLPELEALIMMTDGVSDARFAGLNELRDPALWQKLWHDLLKEPLGEDDPVDALQEWLNFWSPGNHDDRTLAVFARLKK